MEGREVIRDVEDANQCVAGVQRVVSPPWECFWYFIVINVLTFPLVVVVQLIQRLLFFFSFFSPHFPFLRLSINCTAGKKTPHTHTHSHLHTNVAPNSSSLLRSSLPRLPFTPTQSLLQHCENIL